MTVQPGEHWIETSLTIPDGCVLLGVMKVAVFDNSVVRLNGYDASLGRLDVLAFNSSSSPANVRLYGAVAYMKKPS